MVKAQVDKPAQHAHERRIFNRGKWMSRSLTGRYGKQQAALTEAPASGVKPEEGGGLVSVPYTRLAMTDSATTHHRVAAVVRVELNAP